MKVLKLVSLLLIVVMLLGLLSISAVAQDEQTVNILYWQAVSTLNPYLSGGTKDQEAASLILEPLAFFGPDGELHPVLATEIPTLENGWRCRRLHIHYLDSERRRALVRWQPVDVGRFHLHLAILHQ